jgi:hypothetical protein
MTIRRIGTTLACSLVVLCSVLLAACGQILIGSAVGRTGVAGETSRVLFESPVLLGPSGLEDVHLWTSSHLSAE